MSYMLPHLHNGWQVDQAILSEEDRVVVIRFGHDWDPTCMKMDEEQAHHDRPGHRQQQQDQLGHGGQAGDDRHHRDSVPGGPQGPWAGRVSKGLLHQVQILSSVHPVHMVPWGHCHGEVFSTI
nr:thioredoxin-like protein 4A isoform X2 [Odocoileus virginianus texanus]